MKKKLIVVGAGGHAKVVTDILLAEEFYDLVGYIDNNADAEYRGIGVIGNDADLKRIFESGVRCAFVAIGNNLLRKKLQTACKNIGFEIVNIISPRAWISPTVSIGEGNVIMTGAILHADAAIGDGCIINTNASVDHDCTIGSFTHVAPGTAISGYTTIGSNCFLGTGSRVIDKIKIGNNVVLGAGGVIIRNVRDNVKLVGVPAKIL